MSRIARGPDNWRFRPIGSITIQPAGKCRRQPHVLVKVCDDGPEKKRWQLLAGVVWRRCRGPVPADSCLWFINRNSLDCRIENLEAITLAERLRRNVAANYEVCRAARIKQAKINGRRYWRQALDARRLKRFKAQRTESI